MKLLEQILHNEIPKKYKNGSDTFTCHYRTFTYGFVALLCFIMGSFCLFAAICGVTEIGFHVAVMFFFLCLLFWGMGLGFVMMMKNWTIIIHPYGIVYRTILGEIRQYTKEEIKGYSYLGWKNFCIHTTSKKIWINSYCNKYYELKKIVIQQYPEWTGTKQTPNS